MMCKIVVVYRKCLFWFCKHLTFSWEFRSTPSLVLNLHKMLTEENLFLNKKLCSNRVVSRANIVFIEIERY